MKTQVQGNQAITNFALEHNQFLANRYPEIIIFEYDGIRYRNFETAYQSQKMEKDSDRVKAATLLPDDAKLYARGRMQRKNWETPLAPNARRPSQLCECLKDVVMYDLLWIKFHNPTMRDLLVATGDAVINKENNEGEIYWGTCKGIGKGKIGKMLMEIRERLIAE